MAVEDQAASLRRLRLSISAPSSFAFLGGRDAGTSTLVAELGMALALMQHRRVLLADGHHGQLLARRFNLTERASLDVVLSSQLALDDAVATLPGQVPLLNLHARPVMLAQLNQALQDRIQHEYAALVRDTEFVLIDTPADDDLALAAVADDIVLVLSPDGAGLTETYAAVKRLSTDFGRRKFNVLVNRAHGLDEAQQLFQRLSRVASEYLTVSLRWVGFVPEDHRMKRAAVMKTTAVQAFSDCEGAIACCQLANALPLWSTMAGSAPELFERLSSARRLLVEVDTP